MQLRFVDTDAQLHETPLLAVPVTRGADASSGVLAALDEHLGGAVRRALTSGDMRGRDGDEVLLYGGDAGPDRVVLLGVGEADDVDAEKIRRLAGRAVRAAEKIRLESVSVVLLSLIHI